MLLMLFTQYLQIAAFVFIALTFSDAFTLLSKILFAILWPVLISYMICELFKIIYNKIKIKFLSNKQNGGNND
jgi:predicted membrane protein